MFKTTGIDHVAVNTNDMEATLQFYCGILGMRLARTSRTPAAMPSRSSTAPISPVRPPPNT